jgi:hypothetical protein
VAQLRISLTPASTMSRRQKSTNVMALTILPSLFSVSDTVLAIPGMNHYIATKIAVLDISLGARQE